MAPKRGRPRRTTRTRTATGFPASGRRKSRRNKVSPGSEPTSAFEALMQVSSAELKRLNNNHHHHHTSSDNRSDSSSKSAEENRNHLSSPSDVTLPAWYGVSVVPSRPVKNELILPPKKKKYLHYLAEADDDNKIINDPFFSHSSEAKQHAPWRTAQEETPGPSTELKFNPTPETAAVDAGKTLSDVLEEHISRLIVQNDHIVAKPSPVAGKRGKSRETEGTRPTVSADSCMVKNLLSSKLTRKTLAKEIAEQRPAGAAPGFSYLNPENSAIKDLLIKTYEEKGMLVATGTGGPSASYEVKAPAVKGALGFAYQVAGDPRGGSLVVAGSGEGCWEVLQGHEWVFVDERGRKRVRPEVTLVPEMASYSGAGTVPRSPSVESVVSSESLPSSVSHNGSYSAGSARRTVLTNGTFQPSLHLAGTAPAAPMPPPGRSAPVATVRTAGTFHPDPNRRPSTSRPVEDGHEKTLNALRGHLTKAMAAPPLPVASEPSVLPPKKRKSFHVSDPEESIVQPISPPTETVMEEPTVRRNSMAGSQRSHAAVTTTAHPPAAATTTTTYSGYATYVNESHASHLDFYTDLSRQYSSNVAFNRMLLQQGHSLASFRYSCVPTTTIRASRPIHVPLGERVSMYQDAWNPGVSHMNPIIHVDSSIYGKKKMDAVYYSSALKKSLHVGPTSVEMYNHKSQLIRRGINSFLPAESLRLTYHERHPVVPVPASSEQASTSVGRYEQRTVPSQQNGVEDVSDEEDNKETCGKCRRRFTAAPAPTKKRTGKKEPVCPQCTDRPRGEVAGKKRGSVTQARADPLPLPPPLPEPDASKLAEKQLVQQRIQRMLISHQQPLMHAGEMAGDQSAMDLSVRPPPPAAVPPPPVEPPPMEWSLGNKLPCTTCGKVFSSEGQLVLHGRVHDAGKVDKKTRVRQRERSLSPGSGRERAGSNPRPFFCSECNVGFRIHGHLQKHLRSKTHITQLECAGRLQCGFYAELERQNLLASLHQLIDTADCARALASLAALCHSLLPLAEGGPAPTPLPATSH